MDLLRFVQSVEKEFYRWGDLNAVPWDMERYKPMFDPSSDTYIQAMTTPSNMHLLNLAVRCLEPGECYLETGTWRGATLIGALLGNEARGYAIDNDTMDEHDGDTRSSQEVWGENVAKFGMAGRAFYIDGSVPAAFEHLSRVSSIGVYLFDGDKSTDEAAYAGLSGVLPFLSNRALVFLDDANDIHVRMAAWMLCDKYPQNAAKILDIPTPGNCWPCFWNGVIAIVWNAS